MIWRNYVTVTLCIPKCPLSRPNTRLQPSVLDPPGRVPQNFSQIYVHVAGGLRLVRMNGSNGVGNVKCRTYTVGHELQLSELGQGLRLVLDLVRSRPQGWARGQHVQDQGQWQQKYNVKAKVVLLRHIFGVIIINHTVMESRLLYHKLIKYINSLQ